MKSKARTFEGLSYRSVQRHNTVNRSQLTLKQQQQLKLEGHCNVGWDNVIALYQAIAILQADDISPEPTLEELFLEADRIGNKYLEPDEIVAYNQALAQEVNAISEMVDQCFPDTEMEVIDFSHKRSKQPKRRKAR